MKRVRGFLGIIAGIIIIILALNVYHADYYWSYAYPEDIAAPSTESDKSYGGDAYTGIQQAAAQTANNLIPVFKAVENTNILIADFNNNAEQLISILSTGFGSLLLALGLMTVVMNLDAAFGKEKNANPAANSLGTNPSEIAYTPAKPNYCPKCFHQVSPGEDFCPGCGTKLN